MIYITEYQDAAHAGRVSLSAPQMPASHEHNLSVGDEVGLSDVFHPRTSFICIKAMSDCWLDIGTKPDPREGYHPVEAGERLFYGVNPGDRVGVLAANFLE